MDLCHQHNVRTAYNSIWVNRILCMNIRMKSNEEWTSKRVNGKKKQKEYPIVMVRVHISDDRSRPLVRSSHVADDCTRRVSFFCFQSSMANEKSFSVLWSIIRSECDAALRLCQFYRNFARVASSAQRAGRRPMPMAYNQTFELDSLNYSISVRWII